jgi:hypothetical protein
MADSIFDQFDFSTLPVQDVQLHVGATAEVECSTTDTMPDPNDPNATIPVPLSQFMGQVQEGEGTIVNILADEDPSDTKDEVTAVGAVDDVAIIWYLADGADGTKRGAVVRVRLAAKTVALTGMTISFSEIQAVS